MEGKAVSITNFTVVRQARTILNPGESTLVPMHLEQDGFYQIEGITGSCYNAQIGEVLFRLGISNGNQQIFQEVGLPFPLVNEDGFYPLECLSPGIVLPGGLPKLVELIEMDFLLPPKALVGVEIRNIGPAIREIKIAVRFRKIKGVVWDQRLSLPHIENIFLDPRNIEHDDLEQEDNSYSCEVKPC